MKACWKENAQAVANEPQKKSVTYEELKVKYKNPCCHNFF